MEFSFAYLLPGKERLACPVQGTLPITQKNNSLQTEKRITRAAVRCHVLQLHKPAPNNFAHCLCEVPRSLCPNTEETCQCVNVHAKNFPLQNILAVAVYHENRVFKNHFQRVRGQPQRADYDLFDLPSNKRNDTLFNEYATKRLQFCNDFFTV
jgi:hypothetical protein